MENETTKKILRYALTPQIVPRVQELFFSGFTHTAFFIAQIYRGVRLLPASHPYLNPVNMGRFGIRHVVAEAGHNLEFNRQNIDQVIIYLLMLTGIAILFAQVLILGLSFFFQAAYASGIGVGPTSVAPTFANYFLLEDATHDVAFVMLDRVFGLDGFFVDEGRGTTCVEQGVACFDLGQSSRVMTPDTTVYTEIDVLNKTGIQTTASTSMTYPFPYHVALHSMFEVYSVGILIVAVFIFIYFVIAVVAETAQSGTPFGRRFNHVWAPLRIIAAIGMLVPLNNDYADGLNSGQYILLYAAKWGSGFASNGWALFNETAIQGGDTPLGSTDTLVALPTAPPANTLVEFATILATCKISYERMYHDRDERDPMIIDAWLVNPYEIGLAPVRLIDTGVEEAVDFFNQGNIVVKFGERIENDGTYQTYDGEIAPLCGEIQIDLTDSFEFGSGISPGSEFMFMVYYNMVNLIWGSASNFTDGESLANETNCPAYAGSWDAVFPVGCNIALRYLPIYNDPNAPLPEASALEGMVQSFQEFVDDNTEIAAEEQRNSTEWTEELSALGWGGAAIWYNKVAQLNGAFISAAYAMPSIKLYPKVMEDLRKQKAAADADAPAEQRHQVYKGPDMPATFRDDEEGPIARALFATQALWRDHYSEQKQGGDIWIDVMNMLFGTQGLFDIQRNADERIHPLAQLTAIGRTVIDTAIRNLGYSAAAGLGGGIINLFTDHLSGRVAMTASDFLGKIAVIGLTIGFVLFYVIPFLPFIYFFFAVGGWIKGLFEAMVGVPLWALAHIRIDGNGLPGDAAINGYYLILEIFLRPIMIVFGFLASITIFSAQVTILHEIWTVVVSNVTGFATDASAGYDVNQTGGLRYLRGAVDEFFFTVIYAIIVYMLGMSSFKMIDLVPNHILRWMGASVSTFGDQSGDPAENLVRNSFIGANMVSSPLGQGIASGKQAIKSGGDAIKELGARSS